MRLALLALLGAGATALGRPAPSAFRIEPDARVVLHRLWAASLEICGPPAWQGTVHTHIALYDGHRPYSTFSGADRGVMLSWGQRWRSQGTFCLLYAETSVHCELDGPSGSLIFPSATY